MYRLIVMTFIISFASLSYAEWRGPKTIVSGGWGDGKGEFGVLYQDMKDEFPENFYITTNGKVIVDDGFNQRTKVYSNGAIEETVACQRDSQGNWNDKCNILGAYVYTDTNDNIWTKYFKWDKVSKSLIAEYRKTSLYGDVLFASNLRPLAIGNVDWEKAENVFVDIFYEDKTFKVMGSFDKFYRDQRGFVYTSAGYTAPGDEIGSWVKKYDSCGKLITKLDLPLTEFEPYTAEQLASISVPPRKLLNEYGPPVIGPDGSIYAWKRTPDAYSILKWEWVDDSNDTKRDCP